MVHMLTLNLPDLATATHISWSVAWVIVLCFVFRSFISVHGLVVLSVIVFGFIT
jgi:hypothetical protein